MRGETAELPKRKVPNPHRLIVPDVVVNPVGEIQYWPDVVELDWSIRDDPLGRLYERRQIVGAQFKAGRRMQRLFEASEVGPRPIDLTNEPVDGSRKASAGLTESQESAFRELRKMYPVLGKEGSAIMWQFLGQRKFSGQIAAGFGDKSKRGVDYIGRRIRECLTTLAREFGYA